MKKVARSEILDLAAYEGVRDRFRKRIIQIKKNRRVTVGDHMTFVFENRDTVMFQIQEMLRTERITNEKAIAHELETYNELIPPPGLLSATLMIEYEDPEERTEMLRALADLEGHLSIVIENKTTMAKLHPLPGEDGVRLPAVNYLSFEVGRPALSELNKRQGKAKLEVAHPRFEASLELPYGTRVELASDLES